MRKKDLLKKIEQVVNGKENANSSEIDNLAEELHLTICKQNVLNIVSYIIFLMLGIVLFNKATKLSFVSIDFYVITLSIFIGIMFIISIIFFSLYIYNKENKKTYTKNEVERNYKFYQFDDFFGFAGFVIALTLFMAMFIITPVEVNGISMEENFHSGDRVLVWHIFAQPKNNDVIIIDANERYEFAENTEFVIKRLIASPKDEVFLDNGNLYVNDEEVANDIALDVYKKMLTVYETGECFYKQDSKVIIPEGYYIVMGDNRPHSNDSRSVGLINKEDILGICIFRFYPFNEIKVI